MNFLFRFLKNVANFFGIVIVSVVALSPLIVSVYKGDWWWSVLLMVVMPLIMTVADRD